MLSLKRPTCLYQKFLVPNISSNTSHARSFPAISRSFIYKPPPGFVGVISPSCNFFGHSKRQNVGSSAYFTGSQLHKIPSPDEFTQTRNLGSPMTSYFSVVGSCEASFRSVLQSWNAYFAAGKSFHQTICGFTCRILLIGVINFSPSGLLLLHVEFFQSFFD